MAVQSMDLLHKDEDQFLQMSCLLTVYANTCKSFHPLFGKSYVHNDVFIPKGADPAKDFCAVRRDVSGCVEGNSPPMGLIM